MENIFNQIDLPVMKPKVVPEKSYLFRNNCRKRKTRDLLQSATRFMCSGIWSTNDETRAATSWYFQWGEKLLQLIVVPEN